MSGENGQNVLVAIPANHLRRLLFFADGNLNEYGDERDAHVIRRTFRTLERAGLMPARKRRNDGSMPGWWDDERDGLSAFGVRWREMAPIEDDERLGV